ncbi:MAG: zf-HC2 domain-containing protein [Gemmatimonadaceae bacterium]
MQHPDEGMIHTWLDGELSPDESAAFQEHISTCRQCADAVAEARGFVAGSSRIVSALDIVPAGVIPVVKPRQRAWYSSAQFRAAAAVLVVAGASLLVFRNEDQKGGTVMQGAGAVAEKSVPAPTSVAASAPQAGEDANRPGLAAGANSDLAVAAPMAASKPVPDIAARKDALTRPRDEFAGRGVKGGTARGVEEPQRAGFAEATAQSRASDAVATNIAATGAIQPEPKLVRVDSSKTPKQSFYATSSGATLVLTELEAPDFAARGVTEAAPAPARKTMGAPRNAPTTTRVMSPPSAPVPDPMIPFPTAAPAQSAAKVTINTITWFDATGSRRYVLTGPVTVAELEALKASIQKTKQ